MNLHIAYNGNFVQNAMDVFECFFPGENIFLVQEREKWRGYKTSAPLIRLDPAIQDREEELKKIASEHKIDNVVFHGLGISFLMYVDILKRLSLYTGKIYWVFWGYELYSALAELNRIKLVDHTNMLWEIKNGIPSPGTRFVKKLLRRRNIPSDILRKFVKDVDYFCFWFKPDFDLLVRNFETNAKFKYFKYGITHKSDIHPTGDESYPKDDKVVMVNHSATLYGNHDVIFDKLKHLKGIEEFKIISPLSYGSNVVREKVLKMGKRAFKDQFTPVLELMKEDDYSKFLSRIPVAVFGQRRQEAAGNIAILLKTGCKVFLREANPLYKFYRDKGYYIYSVDHDLNSVDDLKPLHPEQMKHNILIADRRVDAEDYMPTFFD